MIAGTGKNVGKTTTFNALRAAAARHGLVPALTSLGRDGEAADAIDGRPKPRIELPAGTLLALPRGLLPGSPALSIVGTGAATSLGPMVFARCLLPARCEIGGPPTATAMREVIKTLHALGPGPVFVDGAIDRIAALAGGGDAVILATGAEGAPNIAAIAARAAETVARLSLPWFDPASMERRVIDIEGVIDAPRAEALLSEALGTIVVVRDPTRIVLRGALFARLTAHVALRVRQTIAVVALTTSTAGGRTPFDPRELVAAVALATGRPTFDVLARVAA